MENRSEPQDRDPRGSFAPPSGSSADSASEREALLVAHLLGELEADEAAHMEAELARDPALRATGERLAATLGLIKRHRETSPALSFAAVQRLQAANRPRPRLLPRLAMAASALFAVGAAWALYKNPAVLQGESAPTQLADARPAKDSQFGRPKAELADSARDSLGQPTAGTTGDSAGLPSQAPAVQGGVSGARDQEVSLAASASATAPAPTVPGTPAVLELAARRLETSPQMPAPSEAPPLGGYATGGPAGPVTGPQPAGGLSVLAAKSDEEAKKKRSAGSNSSLLVAGQSAGEPAGGGAAQLGLELPLLAELGYQAPSTGAPAPDLQGPRLDRLKLFDELEEESDSVGGFILRDGSSNEDKNLRQKLEVLNREEFNGGGILGLDQAGLKGLLIGLGYLASDYSGDLSDAIGSSAQARLLERERQRLQIEQLLQRTCRQPGESLELMFFRQWGVSPFVSVAKDALSTFSIDVDTASYTLCRGMLEQGILPQREAVRAEEFINYFDPLVTPPQTGDFGLNAELCPDPFGQDGDWLLRVVVQAREVPPQERPPLALTFVIDTSGSMQTGDRLELVKASLRQLVTNLDGRDTLALVAFAEDAREVLPATPADQRGRIEAALASLAPSGGTNVEGGLVKGYELAARGLNGLHQHRVVLLSDGVGNIGETSAAGILKRVEEQRATGLFLNTIGVGMGNHNDAFLEQLADRGDGQCNYVDDAAEARKAFVENFTGAFVTIARDVKIQLEFAPGQVESYRQIGYENRQLADRAFRDERVDAGEVHAGQSVTALYRLRGLNFSGEAPLATLRLRYLPADGPGALAIARSQKEAADLEGGALPEEPGSAGASPEARELALPIGPGLSAASFVGAPLGLQRAALVGQFAEALRRSVFTRGITAEVLGDHIERVAAAHPDPEFRAFAALYQRNEAAFAALLKPASDLQAGIDELQALRFQLEQEKETPGSPDAKRLADLSAEISALEQRLRDLAVAGLAGR